MSVTSRRQPPPGSPDTIAQQTWEAARPTIARWLKWSRDFFSSTPGGFPASTPTTITPDASGSAGTEAASWAAADHTHAIATAAPSNPTGATASEGTGDNFMRADATIQQGIVTTKGDLLGYSTVPARVSIGADGLQLTALASETLGLKWGPVVLSTAQITANTNDYAPGRANLYRLSTDASRNITGLVAGTSGEIRYILNVGAQDIVLTDQDAASEAANRFLNPGAASVTLAANEMALILYDATTARWRTFKL